MIHLRSVALTRERALPVSYPFSVPVVGAMNTLTLDTDVIFFIGENGSGKSTLLETIAAAAVLPTGGSEETERGGQRRHCPRSI